jgi:hypothetical protein
MMNETLIYKYPLIKELVERNYININNPIYLNPHANLVEFSRHNTVIPRLFSRHPSNKAIEMMMANPKLVCLESLLYNPNPNIGPLLEKTWALQNPKYKYPMMSQSENPAILAFIEKHPEEINWTYLSKNECEDAIRILEKNQDKIDWLYLSENSFAIEILKKNMDKIVWKSFCKNSNPKAIEMIEQMLIEEPSKISFKSLSENPNAIHIISQHLDKIWKCKLSENPNAMNILMQHPELINFNLLMSNPSAIPYIETRMTEIQDFHMQRLTHNQNCIPLIVKMIDAGLIKDTINSITRELYWIKSVFELDYQAMSKVRTKLLYTELMEKALHPSRVRKWLDYHCENGGEVDDFEL